MFCKLSFSRYEICFILHRPGSSIQRVNVDASQMLREALEQIRSMTNTFLKILLPNSFKSLPFVFNMSGYECKMGLEGRRRVNVPPFAFIILDEGVTTKLPYQNADVCVSENNCFVLENEYLRVELSASGALLSLKDKRVAPPRETISEGMVGNALILYDDIPFYWYALITLTML